MNAHFVIVSAPIKSTQNLHMSIAGSHQCRSKNAVARMAGSKLLARLLLLISSVTLLSLLALTRCGLGGGQDATDATHSTIAPDGRPAYLNCSKIITAIPFHNHPRTRTAHRLQQSIGIDSESGRCASTTQARCSATKASAHNLVGQQQRQRRQQLFAAVAAARRGESPGGGQANGRNTFAEIAAIAVAKYRVGSRIRFSDSSHFSIPFQQMPIKLPPYPLPTTSNHSTRRPLATRPRPRRSINPLRTIKPTHSRSKPPTVRCSFGGRSARRKSSAAFRSTTNTN